MSYSETPTVAEQEAMRQFFGSVGAILPCPRCRDHFIAALDADPPKVGSRAALVAWLVDIHNGVNRRLKKRELTVPAAMEALHASCRPRRTGVVVAAAGIATAAALVAIVLLLCRRR